MGTDAESFELKVIDVVEETADARSISFDVPDDLADQFTYKPGQFLTVAVPSDQTGIAARCYSLCSSPTGDDPPTITVKRTVDGYASNWLVENLSPGDSLRVLPPSGIFTPASLDADLLLFAGGSGITPIMSITRTALSEGSGRIVLFYANRDEESVIFGSALTALAAEHPERLMVVHWLESVQGLPSQEQLRAFAATYASYDAFVCGPAPFMKAAVAALKELEFPRARRHQEKFISLGGNPFGDLHDVESAQLEITSAETDEEDAAEATERSWRARRDRSRWRWSWTARTTRSTTGRPAPSCSSTWSRRGSRRRSPAARGSARRVPAGSSRAR